MLAGFSTLCKMIRGSGARVALCNLAAMLLLAYTFMCGYHLAVVLVFAAWLLAAQWLLIGERLAAAQSPAETLRFKDDLTAIRFYNFVQYVDGEELAKLYPHELYVVLRNTLPIKGEVVYAYPVKTGKLQDAVVRGLIPSTFACSAIATSELDRFVVLVSTSDEGCAQVAEFNSVDGTVTLRNNDGTAIEGEDACKIRRLHLKFNEPFGTATDRAMYSYVKCGGYGNVMREGPLTFDAPLPKEREERAKCTVWVGEHEVRLDAFDRSAMRLNDPTNAVSLTAARMGAEQFTCSSNNPLFASDTPGCAERRREWYQAALAVLVIATLFVVSCLLAQYLFGGFVAWVWGNVCWLLGWVTPSAPEPAVTPGQGDPEHAAAYVKTYMQGRERFGA